MAPGAIFSATRSVHMIVRQLFIRLVFTLQFESSLSMEVISFWMWLEGVGHADFLASVDALDNHQLRSIALAAKMLIETLHRNSGGGHLNHRSVQQQGGYFCREALKGIAFYLNNVCCKVLEDVLQVAMAKERVCHRAHQAQQQQQQQNVMARAPSSSSSSSISTRDLLSRIKASYMLSTRSNEAGGSSSSSSRSSIVPSPKPHILKDIENPIEQCLSSSYPLATLFESLTITREVEEPAAADAIIQIPQPPTVPRDERTLFVTFSNGYPFTADELYEFFTGNFGDDVEHISVQEPVEPNKPPLYAHITFYNQETLYHILAGRPRVKFVIRGKHLWARKFIPKRKQKAHNNF